MLQRCSQAVLCLHALCKIILFLISLEVYQISTKTSSNWRHMMQKEVESNHAPAVFQNWAQLLGEGYSSAARLLVSKHTEPLSPISLLTSGPSPFMRKCGTFCGEICKLPCRRHRLISSFRAKRLRIRPEKGCWYSVEPPKSNNPKLVENSNHLKRPGLKVAAGKILCTSSQPRLMTTTKK